MGVQPSIKQIGKYTVIDVIGAGGMGIVFRAQDPAIGRTVAIKMLKQKDPGATQDGFDRFFLREMKSTGNLHHKNIVTVYDTGEQDGNPYLVMEYLDGEPVSRLISERKPMPLLEKLDVVIQVCDGLQYAHDRNVIHRDIKPANVILLADRTAKIVDFGVARIAGGDSSLVQTGQLVGSLSYMSPEQINSLPLDGRSDIFSTGVMLYELLTHEVPFKGTDPSSTFVRILREDPLPLSRFIPDIPPAMQMVINRALAKDVQNRYQSAEEFGFDLLVIQKDLKAATVADCLKRADIAMQRQDLDRVRVLLQDVLRLDRHNEQANRLLREVRQSIQQQQRSSQIVQIRSQAQVALAGGQYEEALACADQALRLDPSDTESINMCEQIRNAISRAKAVRDALNRAEGALFAGDFDEAKDAVEESLRLDPNDSEARALASVINKELAERFRRSQVQGFVDQARRGIAERKFGDALDALHRAEEIDPTDSNVRELLQWAQRGQDQESRRRYLQDITDQIEKALHAGDFSSACTIAEMGLQRFPEEPTLIRLRTISEKQRDIAERRRFVHDQSLAVKALTDQDKLLDAVQVLMDALRKFPGEPNLESLLAITKAAIERQQFEREEVARRKALQRAENEARAQLTQQVLNWSVELRRSLDARAALDDVLKTARQLRVAVEGKQIDDHAREVANLVLNELNARVRARDQAVVELEQLQRTFRRSPDAPSVTEAESRLLSIKAAFPNESSIQQMCADLADSLSRVREERDRNLSALGDLAQTIETIPTGELMSLQEKARKLAAGIASDPRAGALLQQIDSAINRRFERRSELARDVAALLASLSKVHSLDEIARTLDRATAIAALDPTDNELAERSQKLEVEAGKLRERMESLLRDMAALSQEVASAATVHDAEALVPKVRELAERRFDFQTLQEAATRILAEVQGRRIQHDLIVQELEAGLAAIPLLESDDELSSSALRAHQCRELYGGEGTILTLATQVTGEVERILRERSELRARQLECDNAIRLAEERLHGRDLDSALEILRRVEGQNPDRVDLHLQISLVQRAIEERRAEQERRDREEREREQAEAEQRARREAVIKAIQQAQTFLREGQGESALQCLSAALDREPGDEQLLSTLESVRAEVAREHAEQERLQREWEARQQEEAQARARKALADQAIQEAQDALARRRGEESLQRLRAALERDPGNPQLESALESMQAEVARQLAEQERKERERLEAERLERERIAREKAAAEERARQAAAEQAIADGRNLLAQGRGEESLQRLHSALQQDSENQELRAALDSIQAEIAHQKAEQERQERERLLRERADAEARARKAAAEEVIQDAWRLLDEGQNEASLQCLRTRLERDPDSSELRSTLESIQAELERRRAEQERREREQARQEQLARERADAEARARKAAAEQVIEHARKLFENRRGEAAIQCLQDALERDPESTELRSALETMQVEIAKQRAEEERLERERAEQKRIAREKAEAEARERKAAVERAIGEARELLAQGRGELSVQRLQSALQQNPRDPELCATLESIQRELARQRAEQERLERERLERERIAREKAEAEERARQSAAEQAIRQARKLLVQGQQDECLRFLHAALERDAENPALKSELESIGIEIDRRRAERERLEQERLERERIAQEKAAAEARARQAAAEEAIKAARELLAQGRGQEAVQRLRSALEQDPKNTDVRSTLDSVQAEIARQRAEQERLEKERLEQERLERERMAREKAAAEARARQAAAEEAIKAGRELLAQGRGQEAVQRLRSALEQDPKNTDVRSTLDSVQAEIARQRAEQERLEKERLERERLAKEKTEAEARARKAAAEKAIREARELLAKKRGEESLLAVRAALERDPGNQDLQAAEASIARELAHQQAEQERLERERLERERIAREKAAAEALARQAAAEEAIRGAHESLAQGRGEESLQRLRSALHQDPNNQDLRSTLDAVQAEVARQRAEKERLERERLERERIAKEKAAAEAQARQAAAEQAIKEARELLAKGRAEESLQRLGSALEKDPTNLQLPAAIDSIHAEIARQRAEQERLENQRLEKERLERERLERERIAKEKAAAEALARQAAAEQAIQEARELLGKGRGEESLRRLRLALEKDQNSLQLRSALDSIQAEIARQRAEQERLEKERLERERLERERIAKEKAAAEAQARQAAAEQAIKEARELLAQDRGEESVHRLRAALEKDPKHPQLRTALDSIQAEIARQRAEQERLEKERLERERLERERIAKEKAAAEAQARQAAAEQAIKEARELLAQDRGEESVHRLRAALEKDPKHPQLRTALDSIQAEIARQRAEQKRLERERAKKKAEADARTRKAEAEKKKSDAARAAASLSEAERKKQVKPAVYSLISAITGRNPKALIGAGVAGTLVLAAIVYGVVRFGSTSYKPVPNPTPSVASRTSPVTFTVDPPDSTLVIDGNATDCPGKCVVNLAPGPHKVRTEKAGFVAQESEVAVAKPPQPTPPVPLSLEPIPSSPIQGTVTPPDEIAWNKIKHTKDLNALRKFISDYPNSNFGVSARVRVDQLWWPRIRESSDQSEIQRFIDMLPNGPHVSDAGNRLASLKAQQEADAKKQADEARLQADKKAQAEKQAEEARLQADRRTQAQKQEEARVELEKQAEAQRQADEKRIADEKRQAAEKQDQLKQDRDAVLQALGTYRSAYERKDLNALIDIWPSVPRAIFQKTFKDADKIHVTLDRQEPVINDDTAKVSCMQTVQFGKTTPLTHQQLFRLRKVDGRWIIENDN